MPKTAIEPEIWTVEQVDAANPVEVLTYVADLTEREDGDEPASLLLVTMLRYAVEELSTETAGKLAVAVGESARAFARDLAEEEHQ